MQLGPPLFFGILAAFTARNKGYKWYYWILALGLVGLIVILLMPDTTKSGLSDDERIKMRNRGERTGGILSVISILMIPVIFFIAYRRGQQ
jgi:hypothetical protein